MPGSGVVYTGYPQAYGVAQQPYALGYGQYGGFGATGAILRISSVKWALCSTVFH